MADSSTSSKTEFSGVTFEPELMTRFWQHTAMRMMRANERILHGLMSAASREMELAQELMRYNLAKMNKLSNGTEHGKIAAEENYQELDKILSGLREVTQDVWNTFGDASRLLLEGSLTEAQNTALEPVRKSAKQAVAVTEKISEAIKE